VLPGQPGGAVRRTGRLARRGLASPAHPSGTCDNITSSCSHTRVSQRLGQRQAGVPAAQTRGTCLIRQRDKAALSRARGLPYRDRDAHSNVLFKMSEAPRIVPNMNSGLDFPLIREQAITLRRAGKSRREIKEILRIGSNQTLTEALKGEPPPEWTRRPNAKDRLRAKARELRAEGLDYEEIAAELHVSKSSVSLWVRDLPRPARLSYEECRKRAAEGARRYWDAERPAREAARTADRAAAAAAQIGPLSDREILIAGAIAYWCEGAKSKPHRIAEEVNFINSDADLIRLFLRFLDLAGIVRQRLKYRLHIHETADIEGCGSLLAGSDRRRARSVQEVKYQAAQTQDKPQEHRRRLPRLPSNPRSRKPRPLPEDRGLGLSSHERGRSWRPQGSPLGPGHPGRSGKDWRCAGIVVAPLRSLASCRRRQSGVG
jgi:hypothetical protein